jgi:hypothetical protein
LTDTDGSETLQLTLAGLPIGSVIGDGVHSATVTAAQPIINITGWNTFALALTPPATYSGILNLQATATATEVANGSKASVTQAISVQIDAVAQVPTLTLTPSSVNLSRSVVDTSWEGVCDFDYGATIIYDSQFAGWNMLPPRSGKVSVFQIWGNNDQMTNAAGKKVSVQAASGAGQEWLGLTNGVNSGSSSLYQSPGIEQSINTIDGAQYTLNLDYAAALGLTTANTKIGVYLDGQLIGSYANTSANSLNWQALSFSFMGNGQPRTLRVQLEGGTDTSTARGAMIDALKVIETLPDSASVAYGLENGTVVLPCISAQLATGDTGATLKAELLGVPVGATLKDGTHTLKVTTANTGIDLTGWNLAALTLVPVTGFEGTINLQVRATSTETGNGSTATTLRNLTVQVLDGPACATPVGVNPYVSYVNNTAVTSTSQGATAPVVSPLAPVSNSYTFGVSTAQTSASLHADPTDSDATMEAWMQGLSQSISSAFLKEMDQVLNGGK